LKIADELRKSDISVMLYPDPDKLSKQFKYADSKGIEWVIVLGPDEIKKNVVQMKNMKTGKQEELKIEEVVKKLT
jgi:histidyl-tRNA synthetase